MRRLCTSREIAAPAAAVWDLLVDTRRWTEWGPSITQVDAPERILTARTRGRVRLVVGLWLPFVVTRFDPGRYWAWAVAGVPATGHRVEPLGPARCRLSFEVPALAAPYLLVVREASRRIARLAR